MTAESDQKNEFVLALREHLASTYHTEHHYTSGAGDFAGQTIDGGAYRLAPRDQTKSKDISGFYFRKDLCSWVPQHASDVLRNIYDFSQRDRHLESVFDPEGESLTIRFEHQEYLVTSFIDDGYAGEISVRFMKLPCLFEKAA